MKILIVEDESKTVAYLKQGLEENGFIVGVANNGHDGVQLAYIGNYDLIILNVLLPGQDGWSVVADLRRRRISTPVLFLTARDAVNDRVKGLELGADDYLIEPFAFSELLARVRSVLRRGSISQPAGLKVSDLEVDIIRHRATRAGKLLDLTPKEFFEGDAFMFKKASDCKVAHLDPTLSQFDKQRPQRHVRLLG
jgi:two-component system copper resistance phosphate regulon response regulator CusR